MTLRSRALVAVATLAVAISACSSDPNRPAPNNPFKPEQVSAREQRLQAGELYRLARGALDSSDFSGAILRYNQIALRFPFTDYAVQAQLEKIYALYRNFQHDEALTEADRFLRDYPRHAHADYLQYLKGLVNAERDEGFTSALGFDTRARDVSNLRRAFDDFALLVQKHPQSRYAGDGRQRMVALRNRIAEHELTVVEYYVRRGALVAAAKRAEQIVSQYPGAPASLRALELLAVSYDGLGMKDQASDARRLFEAQAATAGPQVTAAANGSVSAPAAQPQEERGFFRRLFTPGTEAIEGYTLTLTAPTDAPPAKAESQAGESAAADSAAPGEKRAGTLRIYMEPYDDAPAPAAKPEAAEPASR